MNKRPPARRSGMAMIYGIVVITVLIAFASLAVDLGRLQLAKTELRQAADAAARHAVRGIDDNTWRSRAIAVASQNKVDGTVVVLSSEDVRAGNWNATATPPFSIARAPVNAIQVSAERTRARGNPIQLWFASLIGMSHADVRTVAVAMTTDFPSGFIGLNGFQAKNNLRSAGYNSGTNPNPTWETQSGPGMLGSNELITAQNNEIAGFVVLGPEGTHNLTLASPATVLAEPIPTPVLDFSGAPSTNPGGVSKNLDVKSTLTLPGGNYYFTSIDVANSSNIHFSGPATLYIDGDVNFAQNNGVYAYNNIPSNLRIFQRGAGTSFGGSNANNITIVADILAPQTAFQVNNNAILLGAAFFNTIDVKNNAEFYYDEALRKSLGVAGAAVVLVQ